MSEIVAIIREATPEDAVELQALLQQLDQETPYLTITESSLNMPIPYLERELEAMYDQTNQLVLVAEVDHQLVGLATVMAENDLKTQHIGEVGVAILQSFWGIGLGETIMSEVIDWAYQSAILRRLELRVQQRNQRAWQLYQKVGFKHEATLARGIQVTTNEFDDVFLMSYLIG